MKQIGQLIDPGAIQGHGLGKSDGTMNRVPARQNQPQPQKISGRELGEQSRREMRVAGLLTKLMLNYWTAVDSPETRQMQIEDWLDDLDGYSADQVEAVLTHWRRTQTRRPCPAEILAILSPQPKFTEPAHKLFPPDPRTLDKIAAERRRLAPAWNFVRRAMMGEDPAEILREFRDEIPEQPDEARR